MLREYRSKGRNQCRTVRNVLVLIIEDTPELPSAAINDLHTTNLVEQLWCVCGGRACQRDQIKKQNL